MFKKKKIVDFGLAQRLMLIPIQLLGCYTMWVWATSLTFRRYMLRPSSGWKCVRWVSFYVYIGSCFEELRGMRASYTAFPVHCSDWPRWGPKYHSPSHPLFFETHTSHTSTLKMDAACTTETSTASPTSIQCKNPRKELTSKYEYMSLIKYVLWHVNW